MKNRLEAIYPVIYRAFYVILFVVICISGFGRQLGISELRFVHVFFAALILGVLLAFSYCRIRERLAAALLLLMLFIMLPRLVGAGGENGFWSSYGMWLLNREGWQEEWLSGYGALQCIWIVTGCYLLQIAAERILYLKEVLAVGVLGCLSVFMFRKTEIGQLAVSAMLWYIILCFIELTRKQWAKKKKEDHREYMLRILPFCAVYLVLMCSMPAPEEAYDWQMVKDAYYRLQEKITTWIEDMQRGDQEDFGTAQVGFSEDGRLMAGIVDNNEHLMTLQGSKGLITNVYLLGKVYDEFDGRRWEQTVTEDADERMLDTLETLYAVHRYDGEFAEDYIYSTGLSVRYEHFNTGYVFAPLKTRYLEDCEYQSSGSNLLFGEQKGYGTEYKIVYWQLNIDHPRFYEMAEEEPVQDEELWREVVRSYGSEESKGITLEDLQAYQQQTALNYGKDVILSKEVKAYLAQITEGKDSDIEKLRAIEKELASFGYATKLKKLPDSIDSAGEFLDYFLLESKEGYCAYFATAFVMLARAEGIPARYVEGFCVPVTVSKHMNVTSGMAHAWPEVYIEGVGWIPFEPTPGYEQVRYTPWMLKSEQESDGGEPERYMEPAEEEEPVEEGIAEEVPEEVAEDGNSMIKVIAVIIGVVLAGGFLLLVAERLVFARKYKKMLPEEKFKVQMKHLEMLLGCLGYTRVDEETLSELQDRATAGLEGVDLDTFTYYERYLYGGDEIENEALTVVNKENRQLLQMIRQKNRWYYYYICFRYGILKGEKTNG
ncbi:MAG: transglutaminase domain-containing protein [Lachnospiraceae bacterium]|nr:transglutaminase domain-containing protein [Lachnospiraceae bacterium]